MAAGQAQVARLAWRPAAQADVPCEQPDQLWIDNFYLCGMENMDNAIFYTKQAD